MFRFSIQIKIVQWSGIHEAIFCVWHSASTMFHLIIQLYTRVYCFAQFMAAKCKVWKRWHQLSNKSVSYQRHYIDGMQVLEGKKPFKIDELLLWIHHIHEGSSLTCNCQCRWHHNQGFSACFLIFLQYAFHRTLCEKWF